jgi:hypothetical protein
MRLIRSIEAYPQYIEAGGSEMQELHLAYKASNSTDSDLEPVFKSNRYNPAMLINITALVESPTT